ncbi:MAG: hypothetical protein KC766_25825 [Myxococcales bacterium]|nr:hypothetical protein [Myxococcales bacterium]
MSETVIRHANYGLELTDRLTGVSLLGGSAVAVESAAGDPVPTSFKVNASRWVFEDLGTSVTFHVSSDFYLERDLVPGSSGLPSVPSTSSLGVLVPIEMTPKASYPFPRTLTRAIGQALLDSSLDVTTPPVPGAAVTITPKHDTFDGPLFGTLTDENGQYAAWFLPDPSLDPPYATAFDVSITATVDIGGTPTLVSGSLTGVPLLQQDFTGVSAVYLNV